MIRLRLAVSIELGEPQPKVFGRMTVGVPCDERLVYRHPRLRTKSDVTELFWYR